MKRFRQLSYINTIFVAFLLMFSPVFAHFDSCDKTNTQPKYTNFEISEFARESLYAIYTDLRYAWYDTNLSLACLNDYEKWLKKNVHEDELTITDFCFNRLQSLSSEISTRMPLMRQYLALSTNNKELYTGTIDPETIKEDYLPIYNEYISIDIEHYSPKFPELPPLSLDEIKQVFQLLNEQEIKKDILCPDESPLEERTEKTRYNSKFRRSCYAQHYKALIFGNDKLGIKGFPILAFINTDSPDAEELTIALNRVTQLLDQSMKQIEEEFFNHEKKITRIDRDDITPFFIFKESVNRYLEKKPKYCSLANTIHESFLSDYSFYKGLNIITTAQAHLICQSDIVSWMADDYCHKHLSMGHDIYFNWHSYIIKDNPLDPFLSAQVTLGQLTRREFNMLASILSNPDNKDYKVASNALGQGLKELKRFLSEIGK